MDIDTTVKLITKINTGTNIYGEPTYSEQIDEVYAIKKSVKQSEFFQAAAQGFKPEIVLEIYSFEYKNQELCYFSGEKMRIYRAYPLPNSEKIELYLTSIVGDTDVIA